MVVVFSWSFLFFSRNFWIRDNYLQKKENSPQSKIAHGFSDENTGLHNKKVL